MTCETDAEWSKARNFFWKKGPKIHCLALKLYTGPPNCITGASKSGGQGGPGPPPPDPLVKTDVMIINYDLELLLSMRSNSKLQAFIILHEVVLAQHKRQHLIFENLKLYDSRDIFWQYWILYHLKHRAQQFFIHVLTKEKKRKVLRDPDFL